MHICVTVHMETQSVCKWCDGLRAVCKRTHFSGRLQHAWMLKTAFVCVLIWRVLALCGPCIGRICARVLRYFLSFNCYEWSTRRGERAEIQSEKWQRNICAWPDCRPAVVTVWTNYICKITIHPTSLRFPQRDSSFMLPWLSLDWTHSREGWIMNHSRHNSTCHVGVSGLVIDPQLSNC